MGQFQCAVYNVSTLGFAAVHDPVRDAYDEIKISGSDYAVKGIGGGLAVAGVSLATARVGGSLVASATSVTGRVTAAATVGAGAVTDAATQGVYISAGLQEEYDGGRTLEAAAFGAAFGGGSVALVEGAVAARSAMAARRASSAADDARVVGEANEGPRGETPSAPLGNQRPSSQGGRTDVSPADVAESAKCRWPPTNSGTKSAQRERVLRNIAEARKATGDGWRHFERNVENLEQRLETQGQVQNVAKRAFDHAVKNPRKEGLNRMQLGKDAEVQATRWLRKWAERNNVRIGAGGLRFRVRGESSVPDVMFDPTKRILDFKLTPKAVRKAQGRNFLKDFPADDYKYVFGREQ